MGLVFTRTNYTQDSSHKPNMVIIGNGLHEFMISEKNLIITPINEKPEHDNWIQIEDGSLFSVYGTNVSNMTVEKLY